MAARGSSACRDGLSQRSHPHGTRSSERACRWRSSIGTRRRPGPRISDLGFIAWRWVPFWRDAKCRAHGLPTGVAEKARRLRLLLEAYGLEPEVGVVQAGIERMRQLHEHMWKLVADGSAWEVELARRGVLDEAAIEIAWVEAYAEALVLS